MRFQRVVVSSRSVFGLVGKPVTEVTPLVGRLFVPNVVMVAGFGAYPKSELTLVAVSYKMPGVLVVGVEQQKFLFTTFGGLPNPLARIAISFWL